MASVTPEDAGLHLDDRARIVIDTVPALLAYIDADQRYQLTNAAFRAWFDDLFGDVRGRHLAEVVGPAAYELIRPHVEAVLRGTAVAFESRVPHPQGLRWVHTDYVPHLGPDGRVVGFVSQVHDITARKLAEERLAVLAEVSRALGTAHDREAALAALSGGVVPQLADWLAVFVVRDGGEVELAHVAQASRPARAEIAELARSLAAAGDPDGPVARAIASGGRVVLAPPAARDAGDRLAPRTIAISPLVARGRTLGAMAAATGRDYAVADLELLDGIARRAGAALDTASLFEAQVKSHEQLADALRKLSLADHSKDEFLAMLGHELRNPLAPIITALDLLDRRAPASTRREREVIRRQADHLTHLLDDLLDVSRIARGKLRLARQAVELGAVIDKAVELTAAQLARRGHELEVTVAPGLVVDGDPVRLAQVVANLLSNAAKYTDPGGRIALAASRAGAQVRIVVEDDGSGIPQELLPTVFDPFVQSPRTLDRAEGGLGLGLAVVRSLIRLHGGTVQVHSDGPGLGSRFTIELPACDGCGVAGEEARPALAIPSPRGPVLVVDDNVDAAVLLADALRDRGFAVAVAHDARAAITLADRLRPAYALLDLGLPVIDGYELAGRLRAQLGDPALRLIAVTGYTQPHDLAKSREAGFDLHLGKPVDIDAIVDALR